MCLGGSSCVGDPFGILCIKWFWVVLPSYRWMAEGGTSDAVQGGDGASASLARSGDPSTAELYGQAILYKIIIFQGFIVQFSRPDVRQAFLSGYLAVPRSTQEMLHALDVIRGMMLPPPGTFGGEASVAGLAGVSFFAKMLARDKNVPLGLEGKPLPVCKTAAQWDDYFRALSGSEYWRTLAPIESLSVRTKLLNLGESRNTGAEALSGVDIITGRSTDVASGVLLSSDREGVKKSLHLSRRQVTTRADGVPGELDATGSRQGYSKCEMGASAVDCRRWNQRMGSPEHHRGYGRQTGEGFCDEGRSRPASRRTSPVSALRNDQPRGRPRTVSQSSDDSRHGLLRRNFPSSRGGRSESVDRSARGSKERPWSNTHHHDGGPPRLERRPGRRDDLARDRQSPPRFPCGNDQEFRFNDHGSRSPDIVRGDNREGHNRGFRPLRSPRQSPTRGGRGAWRNENAEAAEFLAIVSKMRPRDVVAPQIFDGKDGDSLLNFLQDFQKYFAEKYDGSDRQQAAELGRFLGGRIKQAYEAMGGPKMRFDELAPKLLRWYGSERVSTRRRSAEQFEKAKMESEDSLGIYALRLERLAGEAFPGSLLEQERNLRHKFWKTVPRDFYKVLADNERSLALRRGGHPKLTWSDMISLAESEDRYHRTRYSRGPGQDDLAVVPAETAVWFGTPGSPPPGLGGAKPTSDKVGGGLFLKHDNDKPLPRYPGRDTFINSNRKSGLKDFRPSSRKGFLRPPFCHFCGRVGHEEDSCWRKIGACLVCGSDKHDRASCPKVGEEQEVHRPHCSFCGGGHLGIECKQKQSNLTALGRRS